MRNVHFIAIALLRRKGHDVTRVPSGMKNGRMIQLAIDERRILITQDKDFLALAKRLVETIPGVICLRIHPPTFERIARALGSLEGKSEEHFVGFVFSLGDEGLSRQRETL